MNNFAALLFAILTFGCSPNFRENPLPRAWTGIAVYEIPHKDFGFPQACLFKGNIVFTCDWFDDDEPDTKPITLWVEKSQIEQAKSSWFKIRLTIIIPSRLVMVAKK